MSRTPLEQGRAAFAYTAAMAGKELSEKSASKAAEYKAYVEKLPMYIKSNGLGAAMAFAFAKGSSDGKPKPTRAWGLIFAQIQEWLYHHWELAEFDKDKTLMDNLVNLDSSEYKAATIEVLALLNWMRRFAKGLIQKAAEDE